MCLLTPFVLLVLVASVYGLGVGAVKLPGIARKEAQEEKDWTTLPPLARKVGEGVAAAISLVGVLFGLLGFLLPWVEVNLSAARSLGDLGSLNGTLTGIALDLQSLIVGIGLLASGNDTAVGVGIALLVLFLFITLIPIALLVTGALGLGMASSPLGLIKAKVERLGRVLLIVSLIALCLSCTFFAGLQATVGGVQAGGRGGVLGSSVSLGVSVGGGFWVTVGGLVLALVGAITATVVAGRLEAWAENLAQLEVKEKDDD